MRLAYRRVRVVAWSTLVYVSGLLALACYVSTGPLDPARLHWGLGGFGLACLVGPALGMAWQRVDRSA
jgi:hypothetical protein